MSRVNKEKGDKAIMVRIYNKDFETIKERPFPLTGGTLCSITIIEEKENE